MINMCSLYQTGCPKNDLGWTMSRPENYCWVFRGSITAVVVLLRYDHTKWAMFHVSFTSQAILLSTLNLLPVTRDWGA